MDSQGSLNVIRHGFKCFGKRFRVAYFAPAHGMNPDTQRLYAANRLTITRQLHYSTAHEKSLDLEEYVLTGDDLEPDPGGPLEIEQPTKITTKPLSPKDEDDRVRMVFGLTSNDPLPQVDEETLETYRNYLASHLSFPFEAERTPEKGPMFRRSTLVKVVGLGNPDEEPPYIDEMYGLLCDALMDKREVVVPVGELEVPKGKPNRRLIQDYCYWFWNYR